MELRFGGYKKVIFSQKHGIKKVGIWGWGFGARRWRCKTKWVWVVFIIFGVRGSYKGSGDTLSMGVVGWAK